ncbi:MAG TPA: polyketide cyclase [Rhodobiaceae bacterium]|nr:polyketide cyclase [Rhodobiaceae bacterium]
MRNLFGIGFAMLIMAAPVQADNWFVSKFGKDDTLGAINNIDEVKTKQAVSLVKQGKTVSLGMVTAADTPAYGPRKFQLIVHQLNDGSGQALGVGKTVGNDDTVLTSVGIGSQIDGLGHIGRDHVYYNNRPAADVVAPDGLLTFGTHALPGIVTRGVVLDMTKIFGQDPLPIGTAYTEADIKRAAKTQGIDIEASDVVLLHSGFLKATADDAELLPGLPGLGVSGAHYLAKLGVAAVGADTWAMEALPSEDVNDAFPVHRILLAKYGVYILENMTTHKLVDVGVDEFMFALGVPRLKGAVQAIINPLAIY